MGDARQFAKQLREYGEQYEPVVEEVISEIAKELRTAIAMATPVDTGRAAASWNLNLFEPDESTQPEEYFDPSNSQQGGNVNIDGFQVGDDLVISNSLDYIADLNDGSSVQAPAGFVEVVTTNSDFYVRKAVKKVNRLY